MLVLFAMGGLYRSRLSLSLLDDLPTLFGRFLVAVPVAVLALVAWSPMMWGDYVIYWGFVGACLVVLVSVLLLRGVSYALVRRLRSHRTVAHRTLVLGAGAVGRQVARTLHEHPEYGLDPIGFLDANPRLTHGDAGPYVGPLVLGGPDALADVLLGMDVHNIVVAFSLMKDSDMVSIVRACDRHRCELFVVPRLFELHQVDGRMDSVWGLPLVRLRRATHRSQSWRLKRLEDVMGASLGLLVLGIPMAMIALAVRLEGGPGVLFRQERVGVDGRSFRLLKFRSLRPANETESATQWNISQDHRLGPVGRILRKTSLDELPQLLNILRGEMSLVGPRPERPHFVKEFRSSHPSYSARHRVPSGLTGWAQIHGLRGDTSIADRARFDNYYIENWSLWLDVKIMLRTIGSVLRGAGG